MSDTIRTHSVKIYNLAAFERAASAHEAEILGQGQHQLYRGSRTGFGVKLPNWRFPVIAEVASGDLFFDNYKGNWGNIEELDALVQRYTLDVATQSAQEQGYQTAETELENGEIQLVCTNLCEV